TDILGKLGSLTVSGDVKDAFVKVTGNIGPIIIHGSLIGGVALNSGKISSGGNMGAVTIGHDLEGGFGSSSGLIQSSGTLASVHIGGSLIGGGDVSTSVSGEIYSGGNMGMVTIGHNM